MELFTATQIDALRAEYSKIKRIDPSLPSYRQLTALLNAMSQEQLKQVRDARIPWPGRLAVNRIQAA